MPHLDLAHKDDLPTFRRMAIGTWHAADDPTVYGTLEVRMDKAMAWIERYRARTGLRVTVSHLVARAVAEMLRENPDANALLRFHRLWLRKRIGVFLQVALVDEATGRADLSGVTLYDLERKSMREVVTEMEEKVRHVRAGTDRTLEGSRRRFDLIPQCLMNLVLRFVSFWMYDLNLPFPGMPRDPFGSIVVTNVGALGLDTAYVPLLPFARVPMLLALGAVRAVPVVDNGAVVPGQVMKIHATFDHRYLDGVHLSRMAQLLRSWLEDPEAHFEPIAGA